MEEKPLKDLPPPYTCDIPEPQVSPTAPFPEPRGPNTIFYKPPSLVFENVYEACVKHADDNCCYGKRFANQMKVTEILNKGVFHYKLESFVEGRKPVSRSSPYSGGSVDGPRGRRPDPWGITIIPNRYFTDSQTERQIPCTESVHKCTRCNGNGERRCDSCNGRGEEDCWRCKGSGRDDEDSSNCGSCFGNGKQTCGRCSGSGKVTCNDCSGHGKVKKYVSVVVTWKNHVSNFITNTYQVPPGEILKTEGTELLRQTEVKLQPITNAPEPEINAASDHYLQSHRESFPDEKIIKQRHILRAIPFTRVAYTWKEKEGEFYIYGPDEKMFFENYPQQCCCCICC